jgi:hypothetical protein
MRLRPVCVLTGVFVLVLAIGASVGQADPTNARSLPIAWSCPDGNGGTFEYTGVAISNNHAYTGHVVDPASNANFIVAQTLQFGQVTPMRNGLANGIPGLLKRPDLVTCDLTAIGGQDATFLGIQATGFFTSSV